MISIGPVEKKIYELREEHPLVVPQVDPEKFNLNSISSIFKQIKEVGISHIAIGGSLVDSQLIQKYLDIAVKDFDFSVVLYITNNSTAMVKGIKGKTAVYWMTVLNAENPFFLRDVLILNSQIIYNNKLEPIPTAYVFDNRGSTASANWLTRSNPIPREKPSLSLSCALAAQFLGVRFYIMAGGSGCRLPPPYTHVNLLSKRTRLFLIPTSGIRTTSQANILFRKGADAIQVGTLIEMPKGFSILNKIKKISEKYPGKNFL